MWGKLKSIFIYNGFEPDTIRRIRYDLVDVTTEAMSKLSLGLAMLYVGAMIIGQNYGYLSVSLMYLTTIFLFQICIRIYKKTGKIQIVELAIVGYVIGMLGIAIYDSTSMCRNSCGTFFPIFLLLFAVMFTGNPIVIDIIILGMTLIFFYASCEVKSYEYFRLDVFTSGFVLLVANMVNAMVSRSRISTIIKTAEVEENRQKYAAMAENYQTLYNNVPCGIMELKLNPGKQQIISINSQGLKLYGYAKEDYDEAKEIDIVEDSHPDDRKLVEEVLAKLSQAGDKTGYEYRIKRKDGNFTWVVGQAMVTACDDNGQTILTACVDIDAEKKAIDANEAKSKFLSRMSHDIRTPMNAIIGLTDIVLDSDDLTRDARTNLESVKMSSMFLLGLINDILDVSKIEANEMELHKEPYSIGEFLNYLNTMIRPLCEKKGVEFIVRDAQRDYQYILTDKVRFNQIFFNLLSNAVKFTPQGGQVEVNVRHDALQGRIIKEIITISDTGIGMSEEFQKHMFEPFSQENGEHINERQGSGLGLAIVKQIVDLMNGTIQVESKKGIGTKYVISLDLEVCNEADVVKEAEHNADFTSLNGKRALLCEDQPINRQIAERLLTKAGMLVDSAENGKEGLEKFKASAEGYYDVVLMDIRMPVMGGLEATKGIRQSDHPDAKQIPIIAMTANAFDSDRELSIAAGMNDHINKPVDKNAMYKTLSRYIH